MDTIISGSRRITEFRIVEDRLYCIVGWPVLLIFDIGITWSGSARWVQARQDSNRALLEIWNRNAKRLTS